MQKKNEMMGGAGSSDAGGTYESGSGLTTGTPTGDSERFLAELKTFVSDADGLLQQAKSLSGNAALAAREEFDRRVAQARRGYEQARTVATDKGQQYLDQTEIYVRNEPWKAIGIAALVGAIVGVVLSRR
ncbi:MAG TPA: hypothetical protein VNG69_16345 [Casimicrobiaceae bacterium]|nr:hypothetical protein [Casimicrobiaceae bacterium]